MQRARDRRRGHGQHVDLRADLLQALLVLHAEALLLIHNQQADVLKLDVLREHPVRADEDVHAPRFHVLQNLFLLLRRAEPRDHLDVDRKLPEALFEAFKVLETQHRRGREHRNLFAVLHGLKCRAHRDLGFAIAHVAAQQAVHGQLRLHVALDVADRRELVVGFGEVERVLKLTLKLVVRRELVPARRLALRVELKQLIGHVLHGLAHARLGFGPLLRAQLVEHRRGPALA